MSRKELLRFLITWGISIAVATLLFNVTTVAIVVMGITSLVLTLTLNK